MRRAQLGDLDRLYALHARHLEHIVRSDVTAPDNVVEDACQFAWSRLIDHASRIRSERALSWLATTAVREARRLNRRAWREASGSWRGWFRAPARSLAWWHGCA